MFQFPDQPITAIRTLKRPLGAARIVLKDGNSGSFKAFRHAVPPSWCLSAGVGGPMLAGNGMCYFLVREIESDIYVMDLVTK